MKRYSFEDKLPRVRRAILVQSDYALKKMMANSIGVLFDENPLEYFDKKYCIAEERWQRDCLLFEISGKYLLLSFPLHVSMPSEFCIRSISYDEAVTPMTWNEIFYNY